MGVFWSAAVNHLLRSIPAHLMAYYPFRGRLRFPMWLVLLSGILLQLGQSVLYGFDIWRGGSGAEVSYGLAPIYVVLYFISVRDDRFKVLFLYLLVTDYTIIFRGLAAFFEARFLYRPEMTFDSWTSVAFSLTVLVVTAPFMLRFHGRGKGGPPRPAPAPGGDGRLPGQGRRRRAEAVPPGLCPDGAVRHADCLYPKFRPQRRMRLLRGGGAEIKGLGTGTYAVRETAERSGGGAEFTFKDGVFYASVFLCG